MSYGGVGETVNTPKNGGEFYKHSAQEEDSGHSVRSSVATGGVNQQYQGYGASASATSSGAAGGQKQTSFLEDKVLFWASVVVTIVFALVLVPLGGVSAYKLYTSGASNFYDCDDSVDAIVSESDAIAKKYAGATMNLAPVFINVQMKTPEYMIDIYPQSNKMFRFARDLQSQIGNNTYVWGTACSDVASYFSDHTAYADRYLSKDHYSALFRLAWRHDRVNEDEEESLHAFIRSTEAYNDGNFTFTLTGPGLMENKDSPAVIIGLFIPFYVVLYFFAVMARTSGFAIIVPAIFITCTTIIAAGALTIVDHRLPVTSFSIVIVIATALALTGTSAITLMQRLAANYRYDESHSRSISRRVYLAYTDMRETMFLPLVMAIFLFCVSIIKDEATRSVSLCGGLACCIVFMCNYTLLPACAIFSYPFALPESERWSRLTACLPRYIRRATAEEVQSSQLLSSAAGHENDGRADDSVLIVITAKVRKFAIPAMLAAIFTYVICIVVLFSTGMKVRYNYDSAIRHEDEFVKTLKQVSRTYGAGAMEPWFVIYELDLTEQFISQNDFNKLTGMVNSALASPAMGVVSREQMMSPTIFEGRDLTFAEFGELMNSQNVDMRAVRFRNVFRATVTADSKYAVIKFMPPSKADNFLTTYAEYFSVVQNFALAAQRHNDDVGVRFYGAFGPSAGIWDAMQRVTENFKVIVGVSALVVIIIYAVLTRAIGATVHGLVGTVLNMMLAFFFAAIATGFGGFYYAVSPVMYAVALAYYLHADVVNVLEMLRIRARNRYNEERCNAELVNRTEHVRWGWLVVFGPYFLMVFSLTEILTTFGLCIAMLALADLVLYRLVFIPAFNTIVSERFAQLRGYWWPRKVNEPRTASEQIQA